MLASKTYLLANYGQIKGVRRMSKEPVLVTCVVLTLVVFAFEIVGGRRTDASVKREGID